MCLLSDKTIFPLLHLALLVLLLYALFREYQMRRDNSKVKRGDKSLGYFSLAYGILSVIIIQIISISEWGKGYKVIITTIDLGILMYLTFFNSWFRNKTIGFVVASKNKED